MLYHVRNLREGSRPGNWIRYWENATGLSAHDCQKLTCQALATDGAHVQLVDSPDKRWYIVPLCHFCNCQPGKEFFVSGPLVCATDAKVILW